MIKFFRKIRQQLLSQNRFGKYLQYAIGEILLVVIGILIALQVNNRNDSRNNTKQAINHLISVKQNILEDIKQINDLISISEIGLNYCNIFLDQFKTLKPVDGKAQLYMVYLIHEEELKVNKSGINALMNSGGMTYINKELHRKILNYYIEIEELKRREQISNTYIRTTYNPYVHNNYNWIHNKTNPWHTLSDFYKDDPRQIERIDDNLIIKDRRLEIMIYGRRYQSIKLISLYNEIVTLGNEIINDIDNY